MNYLSRKFIFKTNLAVYLRLAIYTNICECKVSHIAFSDHLYDERDPTEENQPCAPPLLKDSCAPWLENPFPI